ncbi:hypothetical protein NSPZN2_10613 [Nitrospira defluvii]|uniref:Transposase n=1 Tax=Nitrospira defluvii TaxID=330214 RepID=A0ABN7KL64_9BACT|nr:hypothetical protein NSPZN2_10613 [Nitrospira defluvii]
MTREYSEGIEEKTRREGGKEGPTWRPFLLADRAHDQNVLVPCAQ